MDNGMVNDITNQINALKNQFKTTLKAVVTEHALENLRIEFLGRKGHIAALMKQLKTLTLEEKQAIGPLINELKQDIEKEYDLKKQMLLEKNMQQAALKQQNFDVTAYKPKPLQSSLHIYTHLIERLENIFIAMGYEITDGPEVETDYYNFEALNIPADHPARELHDTFWLHIPNMLLRTHTSTVQAHAMEANGPPLALFAPGRCYRNEATDASHDFMFMQAEGLVIDKDISMAHLLATAQNFLQEFFEKKDLNIRVRPGYFPFVEPGVEIDASCPFCTTGCSVCKKTGWIELLGAGLVHPNVLQCSGIDPEHYSGFAFGCGLERLAMIKHGIYDIRLFRSSKINVLKQF